MDESILDFVKNRPNLIAAYGYGSGVFKQNGYTSKDKPQIDLIFVVDDLKKWHLENMKLNKKDYSLIGKCFFKHASIDKLKGNTGITYVSNIKEGNSVFKYGTIEVEDLKRYLSTWESFYLPGRLQKTIYPVVENEELSEAIRKNRAMALLLASFLVDSNIAAKKDLFVEICGLSYLGDTRMKFAENPRKVLNIVEGSYQAFKNIYDFNTPYLKGKSFDEVIIDRDYVKSHLVDLPSELADAIKDYLDQDNSVIVDKIIEYFTLLNKRESTKQTIKGIYTNGIGRSITYASHKILKKFKK